MKKIILLLLAIFTSVTLLSACSNDDNKDDSDKEQTSNETETNNEETQGVTEDENTNDEQDTSSEDDTTSADDDLLTIETEDQLDLGVGDTGTLETTIGTLEITLTSAKVTNEKIDGKASQLDGYIILDLVFKNIGQTTVSAKDILYGLVVTDEINETGFPDGAHQFDSMKKLKGEIAPGETITGQFLTYIYNDDDYYFMSDSGDVAAGETNQVIWTINAEEAREQ